jgi:CheY-like chemotaxis protein
MLFERRPEKAEVARNGREALALFDAHGGEIDAALVDYVMPEMDGGELIRALLARAPELRVILCTGYHKSDEGLDGVPRLEKPFPIATVLAMLATERSSDEP